MINHKKLLIVALRIFNARRVLTGIACASLFFISTASAKCVFPAPDGGVDNVSKRNLAGYIASVDSTFLRVRDYKTKQIVKVRIAKEQFAYTAYGGDEPVSMLKTGLPVRVWYQNCRLDRSGQAVAEYIEVFSTQPRDRPPKNYFDLVGQ